MPPAIFARLTAALLLGTGAVFFCAAALGQHYDPPTQPDLYARALQAIAGGQLEAAESDLERLVLQEPGHAGAWLDLALVKCAQGQAEPTEALLAMVESRFSPPPTVLNVIQSTRARGCPRAAPAQSPWSLKWARGVESNVNQGTPNLSLDVASAMGPMTLSLTDDYLPKADQWTALSAAWSDGLWGGQGLAFASVQLRKFDTLQSFDQSAATLGLECPWDWAGWSWRGAVTSAWSTLGDRPYQRLDRLQLQALRPLDGAARWGGGLGVGWTALRYLNVAGFDADVLEARAIVRYDRGPHQAHASLAVAYDRGDAQRPGRDRKGSSAGLSLRGPVGGDVFADITLNLQAWDGSATYFPGLIDVRRHQETLTSRVALTVPLASRHNLRLELSSLRNQDNVSIFTFNSRQFNVSWEWQP